MYEVTIIWHLTRFIILIVYQKEPWKISLNGLQDLSTLIAFINHDQ